MSGHRQIDDLRNHYGSEESDRNRLLRESSPTRAYPTRGWDAQTDAEHADRERYFDALFGDDRAPETLTQATEAPERQANATADHPSPTQETMPLHSSVARDKTRQHSMEFDQTSHMRPSELIEYLEASGVTSDTIEALFRANISGLAWCEILGTAEAGELNRFFEECCITSMIMRLKFRTQAQAEHRQNRAMDDARAKERQEKATLELMRRQRA